MGLGIKRTGLILDSAMKGRCVATWVVASIMGTFRLGS